MKIIHCADLHLGSKIANIPLEKSKERRKELLLTFDRLTEYAYENGVSAVIIAGDMFDSNKVSVKLKEQVLFSIQKHPEVDYLYLCGNHDREFVQDDAPSNLKFFGDKWTYFNYGNVAICGVAFTDENIRTVYDTISLEKDNINIAVMHGETKKYKSTEDADNINLPELKNKNIDYLALGHYHFFAEGKIDDRGTYAYSGCLEGRGFDELGDMGFVLIDTDNLPIEPKFVPFSTRNFYQTEYDISGIDDWYTAVNEIVKELEKYPKNCLIKLILKGEYDLNKGKDIEALQIKLDSMFYFAKIYDETVMKVDLKDYELSKSIKGEFVREVIKSDLDEKTKEAVITCGLKALGGNNLL